MTNYTFLNAVQFEENTLLDYVERGIITVDDAERIMAVEKEKKEAEFAKDIERRLKEVHSAPITKGNGHDKRWKTRIFRENGKSRQIAKTNLKDLEKELYQHYYNTLPPSDNNVVTFSSLYPIFIEKQIARNRAEGTIIRYQKDWANHYADCSFIDKPVSKITIDEVEKWAISLVNDKKMTKKNYNNVTRISRGIFEIAIRNKLITENPWKFVDVGDLRAIDAMRKYERAVQIPEVVSQEVLSASEMTMLQTLAWELVKSGQIVKNPFALLAVLFTQEHGLRVGELCAVKHSDVVNETIHICRMLQDQGSKSRKIKPYTKGYHDRLVPLTTRSKVIIEYAQALQAEQGITSDYIFSCNADPLPYRAPGRALTILCRILNIPPKHIHSIRKTVTTVLVDSNQFPPSTVAKIMGNSVEVILKNYYFNREDMDSICTHYEAALSDLFKIASSDAADDIENNG